MDMKSVKLFPLMIMLIATTVSFVLNIRFPKRPKQYLINTAF
jgi:hypothetical protein